MSGVSSKTLSGLLIALLLVLPSCGGSSSTSAPTVTGILVQPHRLLRRTKSLSSHTTFIPTSAWERLRWRTSSGPAMGRNWVSLKGDIATCLQPAPVIVFPAFSTVTASAQVNGTVFKGNSGLYCL